MFKKKMFPQFSTLKYKMFRLWKKYTYLKFCLGKQNYDYDWGSFIELNILKLTMMGLQFAKFGVVIDEDRKKQVRTIWEARRNLKKVINAWDITYDESQKMFKSIFGFEYHSDCEFVDVPDTKYSTLKFNVITPTPVDEEQKKVIEDTWHGIFSFGIEYEFQKKHLAMAFDVMKDNLFSWWD